MMSFVVAKFQRHRQIELRPSSRASSSVRRTDRARSAARSKAPAKIGDRLHTGLPSSLPAPHLAERQPQGSRFAFRVDAGAVHGERRRLGDELRVLLHHRPRTSSLVDLGRTERASSSTVRASSINRILRCGRSRTWPPWKQREPRLLVLQLVCPSRWRAATFGPATPCRAPSSPADRPRRALRGAAWSELVSVRILERVIERRRAGANLLLFAAGQLGVGQTRAKPQFVRLGELFRGAEEGAAPGRTNRPEGHPPVRGGWLAPRGWRAIFGLGASDLVPGASETLPSSPDCLRRRHPKLAPRRRPLAPKSSGSVGAPRAGPCLAFSRVFDPEEQLAGESAFSSAPLVWKLGQKARAPRPYAKRRNRQCRTSRK